MAARIAKAQHRLVQLMAPATADKESSIIHCGDSSVSAISAGDSCEDDLCRVVGGIVSGAHKRGRGLAYDYGAR